mgnify:CR=1 FL=1
MQPKPLSRRAVLAGAGATVSSVALGAAIIPAVADAPALPAAEYEDLTRYYAFLWSEFQSLGDELGVGQFCSTTAHRNGDVAALKARLAQPPSTRAMLVLSAMGITRAAVASETHRFETSRPDKDELVRTKLRRAAQDMREAMSLLGHRDFEVSILPKGDFGFSRSVTFSAGEDTFEYA